MKTNTTQENWKKYFYSGIGHASHAGEAIQKSVKELSMNGKSTETEGKKIVHDAMELMERRYNEVVHKLATFTGTEVSKLQTGLGKIEKQIMIHSKNENRSAKRPVKVLLSGRQQNSVKSGRLAH